VITLEGETMTGHPDRATLEAFLYGLLPAGQRKDVLLHLLGGCASCRESIEPLAVTMFHPGGYEPELTPEQDTAYDDAISAAFGKALALRAERVAPREDVAAKIQLLLRGGELPAEAGFWTWALCGALLERSRELRHDEVKIALHYALLARDAAERIDPAERGPRETADLRSRAWAELANAWRVCDDLAQAEPAMVRALELQAEGTGSQPLLARLADVSASLFCDQRRFAEAFEMLDTAHTLYQRLGAGHDAGRVLVMKGLYTGYAGNVEEGLQILAQGLAAIDRDRDPGLAFRALHNILLFRVELGEFAEAQRQLQRMRPLYVRHASPSERVKLRGIEAKITAGLGDLPRAEALFREASHALDAAGLGYQAAIIALDLAAVSLQLGKKAEVRRLVTDVVATFRSLGVEREATAALLMLTDAVERDQATLELLALVSGVLQRLERGPGLLVRPDPD
jgi:tetratricopeptide (TPR) repeat protein